MKWIKCKWRGLPGKTFLDWKLFPINLHSQACSGVFCSSAVVKVRICSTDTESVLLPFVCAYFRCSRTEPWQWKNDILGLSPNINKNLHKRRHSPNEWYTWQAPRQTCEWQSYFPNCEFGKLSWKFITSIPHSDTCWVSHDAVAFSLACVLRCVFIYVPSLCKLAWNNVTLWMCRVTIIRSINKRCSYAPLDYLLLIQQ